MTTATVGAVVDQRVAAAEAKADGLGTPKVTPRHRVAGGRTETMAIAAGSGILKATLRHRGAGGRTETMATAAGSAIQRDIRKPRAVAGKSVGRLLAPTGVTIADPHVPAVGMTTMIGAAAAAVHKADSRTPTRALLRAVPGRTAAAVYRTTVCLKMELPGCVGQLLFMRGRG